MNLYNTQFNVSNKASERELFLYRFGGKYGNKTGKIKQLDSL